MTKRSATEIKARCQDILDDKEAIFLVNESSSPTAAYDVIFAITKNPEKAKAGRWLAVLRRDYFIAYKKLICESCKKQV